MLIAVTSSDGIHIDTHFGKAERFLVYEVGNDAPQLVQEIAADAYCNWSTLLQDMAPDQFAEAVKDMQECADSPPAHRMMPEKVAAIANALDGCRVLVTVMIGEAPQAELERFGISVYAISGPVGKVLPEVAKLY
jgi:predicted Fe-Mo cluster-binding NifX family protein